MSYNSEALTQSYIRINWEVSNTTDACALAHVFVAVYLSSSYSCKCEPGLKTACTGWAWEITVVLLSFVLPISQRQKGWLKMRVER